MPIATSFGLLFLPVALAIWLWRRHWALPLLIFSSVLQSPAVVLIPLGTAGYGITPFNVAALLVLAHLLEIVVRARRVDLGTGRVRQVYFLWLAFSVVSIVGAFVLPLVFAGTPVFLLSSKSGLDGTTVPLVWTINNLAQAVNTAISVVVFTYILQVDKDGLDIDTNKVALLLALGMTAVVGVLHRLMLAQVIPDQYDFWASNPGYNQHFASFYGPFRRVCLPFAEPSYASVWFASIACGCLAVAIFGKRSLSAFLVAIIATAALANTFGTTGLLALAICGVLLAALAAATALLAPQLRMMLGKRMAIGLVFVAVIVSLSFAAVKQSPKVAAVVDYSIAWTAAKKPEFEKGTRGKSNSHALSVVESSVWLGVGSGSNRAASYFLSLLSNTGLVGVALFVAALSLQCWQVTRRLLGESSDRDWFLFLLGATACVVMSVAGSIPDQNWPTLWVILFLGFAACVATVDSSKRAT